MPLGDVVTSEHRDKGGSIGAAGSRALLLYKPAKVFLYLPTTYPVGRTCVTRQKLRLGSLSETDLLILASWPFPATLWKHVKKCIYIYVYRGESLVCRSCVIDRKRFSCKIVQDGKGIRENTDRFFSLFKFF